MKELYCYVVTQKIKEDGLKYDEHKLYFTQEINKSNRKYFPEIFKQDKVQGEEGFRKKSYFNFRHHILDYICPLTNPETNETEENFDVNELDMEEFWEERLFEENTNDFDSDFAIDRIWLKGYGIIGYNFLRRGKRDNTDYFYFLSEKTRDYVIKYLNLSKWYAYQIFDEDICYKTVIKNMEIQTNGKWKTIEF